MPDDTGRIDAETGHLTLAGQAPDAPTAGGGRADSPRLVILPDAAEAALEAARSIAGALARAVEERGRADFATTGGTTPLEIYPRLAGPPLAPTVPWGAVHLWWGDDRFVPRDHPQSNVLAIDDILLAWPARAGEPGSGAASSDTGAGGAVRASFLSPAQVHPFPCDVAIAESRGADWCAARYAEELRSAVDAKDGWPVFDLVLLGIGPDGHLMSVFPGSPALSSSEWALAIPAPTHVEPHLPRVTLNPAILGVARSIVVFATGEGKAEILARLFGPERDPRRWPAQLALVAQATWFVDEAAAARLSR